MGNSLQWLRGREHSRDIAAAGPVPRQSWHSDDASSSTSSQSEANLDCLGSMDLTVNAGENGFPVLDCLCTFHERPCAPLLQDLMGGVFDAFRDWAQDALNAVDADDYEEATYKNMEFHLPWNPTSKIC